MTDPVALAILHHLWKTTGSDGTSSASTRQLAAAALISEPAARRVLKALIYAGRITVTDAGVGRRAARYRLVLDPATLDQILTHNDAQRRTTDAQRSENVPLSGDSRTPPPLRGEGEGFESTKATHKPEPQPRILAAIPPLAPPDPNDPDWNRDRPTPEFVAARLAEIRAILYETARRKGTPNKRRRSDPDNVANYLRRKGSPFARGAVVQLPPPTTNGDTP